MADLDNRPEGFQPIYELTPTLKLPAAGLGTGPYVNRHHGFGIRAPDFHCLQLPRLEVDFRTMVDCVVAALLAEGFDQIETGILFNLQRYDAILRGIAREVRVPFEQLHTASARLHIDLQIGLDPVNLADDTGYRHDIAHPSVVDQPNDQGSTPRLS
jgi:hypothetical protein